MPGWPTFALAVVAGPFLWLAGAIGFDLVHGVLHALLRSRSAWLRALAWPHAVHHEWIGRDLQVRWENQARNIACHIVPEYLTQLVFTAGVAWVLPWPFAAVLALLQTAVFAGILSQRGLDPNHRPIDWLDAYRPGWMTPPAYHALHHVHPNAYYSAYTKLVDVVLGTAAELRGRRFRLLRSPGPLAEALAEALAREGVEELAWAATADEVDWDATDVLVSTDPALDPVPMIEAFVAATHMRRLPPEVWVVRPCAEDAIARHYRDDVRVHHRILVVGDAGALSQDGARRVARRCVARIRRGGHFVWGGPLHAGVSAWRRFRALRPERPPGVARVRHRSELPEAA